MQREQWQSLNDIVALFTARPVAVPLLCLLLIKIYMISPDTILYVAGLLLLSSMATLRWGIHYLAVRRVEFNDEFKRQKRRQQNRDDP